MTPFLVGRWQTRIFVLLVVGVPWTLLVGPILPGTGGAPSSAVYRILLQALLIVGIVGLAWDALYQALMYLRWEKDWPALFGLFTGINEGISTFIVLNWVRDGPVPVSTFVWHFSTVWILTFLFANTFMRVLFVRWRFRGGRIL